MRQESSRSFDVQPLEPRTLMSAPAFKLLDVPNYDWYYGCVPTAVGMVMGWWDEHGFPKLIPGDASTMTQAVKDAIASPEHRLAGAENKPISPVGAGKYWGWGDWHNSPSLPNHEANPVGLADYMKTVDACTRPKYVNPGITGWLKSRGQTGWTLNYYPFADSLWSTVVKEVAANRPVLAVVDAHATGKSDHVVPIIGYNSATHQIAVHTQFDGAPVWKDFLPMAVGREYGIEGFRTVAPPAQKLTIGVISATAREGGADAVIRIKRTGPDFAQKVNFTIGGTAINGKDYSTIASSVWLPAGATSATVTIHALADKTPEGREMVTLTLKPSTAYVLGTTTEVKAWVVD